MRVSASPARPSWWSCPRRRASATPRSSARAGRGVCRAASAGAAARPSPCTGRTAPVLRRGCRAPRRSGRSARARPAGRSRCCSWPRRTPLTRRPRRRRGRRRGHRRPLSSAYARAPPIDWRGAGSSPSHARTESPRRSREDDAGVQREHGLSERCAPGGSGGRLVQPPTALYRGAMATAEVRRATVDDAERVAGLLHDFNTEFDTDSPGPAVLAERLRGLLAGTQTFALLSGDPAVGIALVTLRPNVWYPGPVALLDEMYVAPQARGGRHRRSDRRPPGRRLPPRRGVRHRDQRRRGRRRRAALLRAPRLPRLGSADRRARALLLPGAVSASAASPSASGRHVCRAAPRRAARRGESERQAVPEAEQRVGGVERDVGTGCLDRRHRRGDVERQACPAPAPHRSARRAAPRRSRPSCRPPRARSRRRGRGSRGGRGTRRPPSAPPRRPPRCARAPRRGTPESRRGRSSRTSSRAARTAPAGAGSRHPPRRATRRSRRTAAAISGAMPSTYSFAPRANGSTCRCGRLARRPAPRHGSTAR